MLKTLADAASGLKEKVAKKSEIQSILAEATNNDNWNISNSKLQILADHTYDFNDYNVIMKHLWSKLSLKPKDWRKIFKSLHAFDFLLKNGAPKIVQELRDELYKIRSLQDMEYVVESKDKCTGIREKSKQICELLADQERLEEEREFARKNRDKFASYCGTGTSARNMGGMGSSSKYQGFGSNDIQNYSASGTYTPSGYDPYGVKKDSVFTSGGSGGKKLDKDKYKKKDKKDKKTKNKTKHKKKPKKSETESEDDSDEDESDESDKDSSDEESSDEEKHKKTKAKKSKGITQPKATKQAKKAAKNEAPKVEPKVQKQGNILDILEDEGTSKTQPATGGDLDGLGIDFGSSPQPQQNQNMFANMSMSSNNQSQSNSMNDMFANMSISTNNHQQQPVSTGGDWSAWGSNTQPSPQLVNSPPVSNITNTYNLFGDMNINQPAAQNKPQATSSFNMFDGMNQMTQPASARQIQSSDDGFGAFTDSSPAQRQVPVQPQKPKKDDAWEMGGKLFNLSGLKKDSEKQDKLYGGNKHHQEKSMLHTHGEDLNTAWNSGSYSQYSTSGMSSGFSGSGAGAGGLSTFSMQPPSSFPTNSYNSSYTTGFSGSNPAFGGTNQGFGGSSSSFSQQQPSQSFGGFGQNYPGASHSSSSSRFNYSSQTEGFSSSYQSGGVPSQNNQGFNAFGQSNNSSGFPSWPS